MPLFGGLAIAGGSIIGSLLGGSASKQAAQIQAGAATHAADLQNAQFQQTQANLAPWLESGKVSLSSLMSGLQPGGEFSTPFSGTFKPPTLEEAQQTPGYRMAQQAGQLGIERGNAAAGGVFSNATLEQLAGFNNNLSQNAYQQAYNNALNTFSTQFNTYNTNQSNLFNRLAGVAGVGQTTGTQLGALGQQNATTIGNLLTGGAAATAGGIVGQANAYNSGIAGATNGINNSITMNRLFNLYQQRPAGVIGGGYSNSGGGYDPNINVGYYDSTAEGW